MRVVALGILFLVLAVSSQAKAQITALTGDCAASGTGSVPIVCTQTNGVPLQSGATTATGTSGATLPLLNGTNTWSGAQTFSVSPTLPTPASTDNSTKGATTAYVQGASITSTGSSTSRTLPVRFADAVNVLDWGAKCDGSTDDTAAIQAAINAAGAKVTYIPASTGHACEVSSVSPITGTHLWIDGTLQEKAAGNSQTITSASANNVIIEGHGVIDGNKANQTTSSAIACLDYRAGSYLLVQNLTLENCHGWAFNIWATSAHVRVFNVTALNYNNSAEFAQGCDDCWADHLTLNTSPDFAFAFYGNVTHSGISNSYVTGSGGYGIVVLGDSSQQTGSHYITITGNTITANVLCGGVSGYNASNLITDVVFTGNVCDHNGETTSNIYGGWVIAYGRNISSRGNIFTHDGKDSTGSVAIFLSTNVDSFSTIGDTCYDEGQGSTSGYCLYDNSVSTNTVISNLTCRDDQATPTMKYCTYGTLGANALVEGVHSYGLGSSTPDAITRASDTASIAQSGSSFTFGGPTNVTGLLSANNGLNVSGSTLNVIGAADNVAVYGSASGGYPTIQGFGSDTNVNFQVASKGTGLIFFTSGSGNCYINPPSSTLTCSSDLRLKDNIVDYTGAIGYLNSFRIRDYNLKSDNRKMIGVVAQEVSEKHPEMVHVGPNNTEMVDSINTWVVTRAIQEMQVEIDELKSEVESEKSEIQHLRRPQ